MSKYTREDTNYGKIAAIQALILQLIKYGFERFP